MASYNSVTFYPLAEDSMFWPYWEQELVTTRRHIPYSDTDDLQFGGLSNFKLEVEAEITSDANLATLRSSMDGTGRTLTDFNGTNYTDCYLTGMADIRKWDNSGVDKWVCTLTFERTSAP